MHIGLVIAKLITVALGGWIAYQAYRGYRRYQSVPMLYVAVGFTLISAGAVLERSLYDIGGLPLFWAGAIQTVIVASGMCCILYSVYGRAAHQSKKE
jgi:hypothetical protein